MVRLVKHEPGDLSVRAIALALGASCLWPLAASAQTTTCQNTAYGMPELGVTCRTSQPTGPVDPKNVSAVPCSFADRRLFSVPDSICEARAVAAAHKAVGDLLAAGKCDDAQRAALATGDIAFAKEVREFCAVPTGRP